jgi:hypothetical protein
MYAELLHMLQDLSGKPRRILDELCICDHFQLSNERKSEDIQSARKDIQYDKLWPVRKARPKACTI